MRDNRNRPGFAGWGSSARGALAYRITSTAPLRDEGRRPWAASDQLAVRAHVRNAASRTVFSPRRRTRVAATRAVWAINPFKVHVDHIPPRRPLRGALPAAAI